MDNNINNAQKAEIIAHALPHIQKYRKKTVVVKYGGNAMINDELKEAVMRDLVLLTTVGIKVVLVHGGGPAINKTLEKMHIESKFENGLRVTDKDTVDVVQMVLAGKVNKDLVCQIGNMGGHAIGLSGMDGNMIKCKALDDSHGFVGEIQEVNTEVIEEVLNHNFIPVISTIGYDEKGNCYNIPDTKKIEFKQNCSIQKYSGAVSQKASPSERRDNSTKRFPDLKTGTIQNIKNKT